MNDGGRPEFVLAAVGTRGDILPLIALGRELVSRGYRCHLLANEPFADEASAAGLRFMPVAPQQNNNITSLEHNLGTYLFPSYAPTFEYFQREFPRGKRLVVVNMDNHSASSSLADLYDAPICRLYLAPFKIRSLIEPFWPLKGLCQGAIGRTFSKYTLPKIYAGWDTHAFSLENINRHRAEWGLPLVDNARHPEARIRQHVALFPSWYCAPVADWPAPLEMTSFPLPSSSGALPPEFLAFVEREGKPLIFTPGTGVPDVADFFQQARRCCEEVGLPGVFLSPHADATPGAYGSRVARFAYLDLEAVLRHAALLVHHGGIGTTARAIQAGVPQIISPLAYDQPDNGHRVEGLGVGGVVQRIDFQRGLLASRVRELLASSDVRAALSRYQALLAQSDAIGSAVDVLERAFAPEIASTRLSAAE